jgi:hypothetical protein
MKEWTTRKKRVAGVLLVLALGAIVYLAGTRLWDMVLRMHHM